MQTGQSVRGSLRIHKLGEHTVTWHNNRNLTVVIVDPDQGDVVGSFSGMQHFRGYRFEILLGAPQSVPLLMGTASLVAQLGYAISPGDWAFRAPLNVEDGRELWTPALEFAVIP